MQNETNEYTDDTSQCPQCGSATSKKGVTIDKDGSITEIKFCACLSCDWDNRSTGAGTK